MIETSSFLKPELTPEEMLQRLDRDIRRFRIDFERFFSGNLPIPPEQLRVNIQNQIKELRTTRLRAVALRFRYNSLEAKFNALLVLFNRRLREQELGKGAARPDAASEPDLDPGSGIVIGDQPDQQAVQALYKGLYAGSGSRKRKADFDQFQSYLQKQARQIREKTGCREVSFRVSSEGGKLKLKAKPI